MRRKYHQRGEIATILAVLSMAVMMIGVAVGSNLSSKRTTSARASGTEYYTYCNDNDRGDNPGQPGSIYAITNKSNYVSEKDTCGNGYITEWYCDGANNPHSVSHVCNQCTQGGGGDYCETIGGVYKSPTPVPPSATPQPSATTAPQATVTPSPTEPAHTTQPTITPSATPIPTTPQVGGPVASITPSPTVTRAPTGSPLPTATRVPSPTPTSTACIADGESTPNPNNSATRCCSGVWYVPTVGSGGYVCGYRPGSEPTVTPVPAQQYTLRLSGQHSGTGKSYGCTLSWTKNGSTVSSNGVIKNGTGSFDCTGGATNSSAGVLMNLSENYSWGIIMSLEYSKCSVSGCAVQSSMYAGAPSTLGGSVSCNWNFNADGTVPTCTSGATITLPSPTPARVATPTLTLTPTPGVKSYVMQLSSQSREGKTYNCSVYWKKGPNGIFDNGQSRSGTGIFTCADERTSTTDGEVSIKFNERYSLGYEVMLSYGVCNGSVSCNPTSTMYAGIASSSVGAIYCRWSYESGSPMCQDTVFAPGQRTGSLTSSESQYYAMFDADNNKTLTVNDWLQFVQNMPPACSGRVAVCASQLLSHLGYQLQK